MLIGYDAKRILHNFTGLGNYSRFVISNMRQFFPQNNYLLFSKKISFSDKLESEFKDELIYRTNKTDKKLWRSWRIIQDIEKENIDIYHGLSNELPFHINKTTAKSVVTIHDLIFLKYPRFYPLIDRTIYNLKAKYACRVADKIVAVSECTKRDIMKYYKISPDKIDVVYQGCFSIFKQKRNNEEIAEIKRKHNLPERYLLSVGSIEERKNILLVIKAIKEIPNLHLVAIGKQQRKYAKTLHAYISKHGLADRVHLKSGTPLADLPAIYQGATVFVYPSLYEGFGIPILEALCSGIPVIGATGSCLEEAGGPHSIYVNPHDEQELIRQLNRILSDRELAEKMVCEGYKYSTRFSDEACTKNMMKVYQSLL